MWPNTNADVALFSAPVALLPVVTTVTLSSGITANQLSFLRSGYLLTGGDLTLAGTSTTLRVAFAETATIGSQIRGTEGLTVLGGGTTRLTNATNSYTGITSISNGILSINSNGALGADSSTIVVNGSVTRGFGGGALMLAGGYSSGVTLARDVSLQGLGPVPAFGAALLSVGNNTMTGALSNGSGTLNTGIHSAGGRLTLTDVTLAGTTGTIFMTVGVGSNLTSVPGSGSYAITGVMSGSGSIQKSGGGTLIMAPSSASGYTGTFRIYSGSMRFESAAAFGSNAGTGIASTLDLAGDSAMLELRMDNGAIGKNVYNRGGGSPIIVVDHAIGSAVINGMASFGTLTYDDGETITFNGRNGFGVSFQTTPVITGDGNTSYANNLNGTLVFTGDFWGNLNNSASRTMTISGNGDTLIDGSVIATSAAFNHHLTKTGSGTLTITGSASTYTGNTTVSGTLSMASLGAINGSSTTGGIILGATTTTGTIEYTGAAVGTLAKSFSLAGTTAGGAVLSNGTGALTLTGAVSAGGVGIKTFFLGGSNAGDNTFSGFLMDNTSTNTTGLMKTGTGTWVVKESTFTASTAGSVTIAAPGTTATTTLTLSSGTTAGMVVGQTVTLPGSTQQITGIIDATRFTIGTAVTTTTAPAGTYTVNAIPVTSTSTMGGTWSGPLSVANGILKLQATNAASNIVSDGNAVMFNLDSYTFNQTAGGTLEFVGLESQAATETLGALLPATGAGTVKVTAGAGGTATLTFASLAQSSTATLATAIGTTSTATLTVASTAGLAPGMRLLNGSAAAYIVAISSPTSVIVSANQVSLASGTVLNFGPGNGTVNYVPDANSSVVFASVPAVGLLSSSSYFKGADFAYAPSMVNAILRAPVYGTDAGFVTAGAALTANNHNLVSANTSTGAATVLSLKIDGTSSPIVTQTGLLTIRTGAAGTTGGILVTGGTGTINGTGVTTGGAADLYIRVDGVSDTLFLNAPVTATTTGGLIKTGAGMLVIGGVNAQTTGGTTQLEEGTIKLVAGGRLSAATVGFYMRQNTVFDLNGVNVGLTATTSSIGTFSGAGRVTNTSATAVVFAIAGSSGVFNGSIDQVNGRISVVKMGTSTTQVFNGLSNYTGSTTIGVPGNGTTGTLSAFYLADIGDDSSIGRGDDTSLTTNQGSLIFGGTTGGLVYTGTTSVSTDRLFTMAGTVATAGATITNNAVNNQALIFRNTDPIAFASANPQLLQLGGTSTGDSWFYPQITNSGTGANITSVNKVNAGVWVLGNTNNLYTGTTTITDGILVAQDGSSLPNASGLILGGTSSVISVFQSSGEFTRNLAASASAGANTVSWNSTLTTGGAGFAASTDKLVVAIGGLATPTALTWNVGGFMGTAATTTGPLVLNSTTALGEVEFRNAIDLGGAVRTIMVNDNTSTFTDFATITGVISGNGGITKGGTGLLQLFGNNTYTGITAVATGQLVVNSLGKSGNAGGSSVGDSTNANTQGNALTLGNASTGAGILQYVGAGEISDRMIRLNTTTGSTQILADGSGALILTNVLNDMVAGTKTLFLRGGNTQGNMITSALANNGGNLSVTVDQGATWILGGNNTYSGNTTVSAGALGAASDTAFGTGILNPRSGTLFAYGGDRTLANALTVASTTTGGVFSFMGEHSLTLNGTWTYTNTTAGHTITNSITSGKALIINGTMALDSITANVSLAINGSGNTVLNGNISTTKAFGVNLSYSGDGTLTLVGDNTTTGTTTINNANGTVILGGDNVLGSGTLSLTAGTLRSNGSARVIANNVTHGGTFIIGGDDKVTFSGTWLNSGASRTLTVNTAGGVELAGQVNLSESATSARTLTINGTGDVLISGLISNGIGTGASALAYTGSGTLTITNGANSYTGTTTLNNAAGTLRLTGAGKLSTGNLTVNAGTLSIEGVSQSVATLAMGNVANTTATVNVATGLTLTVTGISFSGTTTLPSIITGDGTLNLGTAGITVTVADNTTQAADMIWTIDNLTGSGAFIKAGTGTLDISGIATNSFTGSYQITAGAIMGLEALNNNIALNGGVYQTSGTFTRALGTGSNEVQFLANGGGFAAVGGDLTVTFASAPSPLVWGGTPSFVPNGAPLIFGSIAATGVTDFTHDIDLNNAVRTISTVDNTTVTTDWALLSGVLSNGGITKTGNGILRLGGASTFTGAITVSAGTLQFSTVSNNGGGPSNLGQGTGGITLGSARLEFIGSTSQTTNRAMATSGTSYLFASGTGGATITYTGAINVTGANSSINLDGSGDGYLNGKITTNDATNDLNKNGSGTWTINVAPTIQDNMVVRGGTLILAVAAAFDGDDAFVSGGGTIKLGVNGALTGTMDDLNVSTETSSGGILDINGTTGSTPADIILGSATFSGSIIDTVGTGSIGVTGTFALRNGTVSAAITGSQVFNKTTVGTVTLSGNNAGFTGATNISEGGLLVLDYTTNNGEKLSDTSQVTGSGGGLTINGSATAATVENIGGLTLGAGHMRIAVNHGTGQTATLNLGAITRAAAGDGMVDFSKTANATITTSSTSTAGILLGGWATFNGTQFAAVSGINIIGAAAVAQDNVSLMAPGGNITDSVGYFGVTGDRIINSLVFSAAATSTVTVQAGSRLSITSGGILVSANVGANAASIMGGLLKAGGNELFIHQHNTAADFTIGSSLTGNMALTKGGLGTLVLSGTNTHSGLTAILEGTLRVSGGNAIGDASVVKFANVTNVLLDLNNGTETIGGLTGGGAIGGTVAIGTGTLTLAPTATQSFSGSITGSGTLVKNGAGTQQFLGNSSGFTGTVIINQGLFDLSESSIFNGATAFIVNGTGELLSDLDVTGVDHIGNNATITLNNTGANRGLWARNPDVATATAETVGAIILGAGHNSIVADTNGGTLDEDQTITLTASSLTRTNHATLLIRGQRMDQSTLSRSRIIFTTAAPDAVGGGSATGTTMSILPYMIGEVGGVEASAALSARQGNSFVLAAAGGATLRPLSLTIGVGEEYTHNEAGYNALTGAALDNVRFTVNPAAALTGAATQINSLVLDSSAAALVVNGPASTLNIKSGAILATTTTAGNGISLGGFSSLTTDAGNDFIVYVTNVANTFTLNSALASATPLVKSGAGTLALTNTGNAFTDVYLNQGFVQVDNMDKLGTGVLKFMGGGIKLAPGFTGDLFAKTWDISTGGGSLDVSLFGGGFTLTNGIVDSTPSSSDVFSFFTRATGSTGDNGMLTLRGSTAFTGTTVFRNSGINNVVLNSVVLNGDTNATLNGNVEIGNLININDGFDVVVALGANEQIVDTASITFRGASGENAYFKLSGFTETVAGISDATREGVIENLESTEAGIATDGKLIVNSSSDFSYGGYLRNRGSGSNPTLLAFEKQGTGTQTLFGDRISYTGTTTISGGTLYLQGVTAWNSDIVNNSVLVLDETVNRIHSRDITGTGSLVKTGSASVTFAGGLNLTYQGSTTVQGGTMTVGSSLNGSTSLSVLNSGSTLALTGGISNASSITSLVVEHGATLSLLDGAGNKLNGLTNLQLGSSGGLMTTLNLNVGDGGLAGDNLNTDLLSVITGGTLALFAGNQITLNLTDAGLNPGQTYNLISAADGGLLSVLAAGDWLLGSTPGGFTSITIHATNNLISITTGTLITGASYWTGLTNNTWNGAVNNWSTDKAGTIPAASIPGQGTDVVFVADSHAGGALVTTLEQNFKVNSLTFESSTSTPSSVTINPGTIATSRLEVAPQISTDGIKITAGGPAAVTIATPLKIGANQTWNITSASTLTISGALQGEADVIKTGGGKITLSAAADPTFNTGLTTDIAINEGILEITNAGALGTTISSNPAHVIINGTGVFYYNGVAGTVANALTLGGGTLSAGTGNQIYSGAVTVSGSSLINMRDNNSATTSATARNITLSGALSGSGSLTVDSVDSLTGGNAETGTLTLSNNANAWDGDLIMNRGTLITTATNGLGGGSITFNQFGRIIVRAVDGTTYNLAETMNFSAGAIGEFSVDNTGALAADFVINQNGAVNIGSGGVGATARFNLADVASKLNLTGDVVLGGNSSISVEGGNVNSFVTISGVISDGGSGYSLAVNDDQGAWAVTNTFLRLTGLNTFSGNLALGEGTLQFNTISDAGGVPSSLGQGNEISMAGGTLSFIGDAMTGSQFTNRAITLTASSTLNASGTDGAIIMYTGAISAAGFQLQLTGTSTGAGFIMGGIIQNSSSPDLLVSSGNWTLADNPVVVGDDFKINGIGTVLNLGMTGVLSYVTGTSNFIYMGNGSTVNFDADDVSSAALGLEGILVGFETTGAATTLNVNTYTITTPRLDVGQIAPGLEGNVIGSGTINVTVTTAGSGLSLYRGSVSANLSGAGALLKGGMGDVILSGDNSGLTGTIRLDAGNLILDYTTSNTNKLNAATALDMRGGTVTINGSASAATSQTVTGFVLSNSGSNKIFVNSGTGQQAVLNLGAITRANTSQDGTVRFALPSGTQSATNGITTSTLNGTHGLLGLSGFATVTDSTGTWFATNATNTVGGNIVALASTVSNDVTTWAPGGQITDGATGFTGTLEYANINSLRFNAAAGAGVNVAAAGVLSTASGGILVTDSVTSGTPGIFGGTLVSGVTEIIITQDSARTFEISSDIRINHAITKTGAGTLLLSGRNVYTGVTEIQEGTLQVSGGNAIGDISLVTLADDRYNMLQLLADETIGRLAGGSAAAGLSDLATVDVGAHTLTINQTANTTYAGLLTGTGTVIKQGGFQLLLTNLSSGFTGTLIIEEGLVYLNGIGQINASVIEINKGGNLLIDNNGTTRSGTRISDNAAINLNSADGVFVNTTVVRGLALRADQDTTLDETVGVVTAASGASYVGMEAITASDDSDIIAANLARTNSATLNVRGTNLGTTSAQANQFRILAANEAAFIAGNLVGGNGGAGTKNISIVPWAIGEATAGALADTNMGNSLVTYVATAGFRPLAFTEYNTYTAAGATDNVRASLSADLTGLAGKTLNALVIDNDATLNSISVMGTGAGQTLTNTSGAFLFTLGTGAAASTAYSTTLGGFGGGIAVGGTNEYVFFVVNPSAVATTATLTATISSALTSTADITKSGRGTLILSGSNTAGGGTKKTTLNEGTLEITDLDNIGGNNGALVFAGGTLRLGAGFTDDFSTRAITFFNGGATLDTNGIDLALANSVGSGAGGLTKTGLGNLTLNAAATYTGTTTISVGTLTVGADNATGVGGDLMIGGGTTLNLGAHNITAGLVSTSGASPAILGSGRITASGGFSFGNTGDIVVDAILAGTGGLLKTQANVLTLSGLSTFGGVLEIQAGTLSFNSITSVGGGASALGSVTTAQGGVIHMGLTTAATTLNYTGAGSTSDRTIGMQGTTGALTVDASGTGALVLGGVHFETAGSKTLTLKGSSDPLLANTLGALNEYGLGVMTLIKSDPNTWVLSASNSYSGNTSINDGILRFTADQNLAGGLNFGSASSITTAGTLDLSGASATFAGMLVVQTNSVTNTNKLIVGAGENLTVGSVVTLGSSTAASTTLFSVSGGGTFNVTNTTNTGVTFQMGGGNSNFATADFSALASMNVSLNTASGILQIGSASTTASTGFGTLILAQNTTVTASALTVGGGGSYNNVAQQINSLQFGTGSNTINVDAFNIGTGSRDLGSVTFFNSSGTVTIRAADGTSAAAFNMSTGTANTPVGVQPGNRNTFDVRGHEADLLFSTFNIGTQTARTGSMENYFAFDDGKLVAGNLVMGSKAAAGNSTNTMDLGGDLATTVTIGSGTGTAATLGTNGGAGAVSAVINVTGGTVTIGSGSSSGQALILGSSNTNIAGSTTTALNVSGGNVTLATTGATAVTMANATTGTANATIGISGGTLTVQGAIVRGAGPGTRNATITLNGGTLDMSGKVIGAVSNAITFNAQSGTLKNLAELNGGGAFEKTTADTLYMDGVNNYTGTTTVSAGTLQFLKETALYNNTTAKWTDANIVVNAAATAAFNVGGAGEFTAADVDVIKTLGTASGGFKDGSFIGLDTSNASGGNFTYGSVMADTNGGANSVGFKKLGSNTLALTQTSTYTGTTTVAAGTLQVGDGTSGALAGAGSVTVSTGAALSGSGSIAGATVISSGAVLAPGVGVTNSSNQTLTFTAINTAVDVSAGGQIQLGLTASSQIDTAFTASGTNALTYLNSNGGAGGAAYTSIWAQSGDYDSIKLTNGTFNLASTAGGTIKVLDNNASLTYGSIFKLLDWSTVGTADSLAGSGAFTLADLDLSSLLGAGYLFDTSAFTTYGVIVVVPEPSRMVFLMLGVCGFMLRRRRR